MVKAVRCNPDCTWPELQQDMSWPEEEAWGGQLKDKNLEMCSNAACAARPARYQPVVGLKEKGDIMEDLLGMYSYCSIFYVLLIAVQRLWVLPQWMAWLSQAMW